MKLLVTGVKGQLGHDVVNVKSAGLRQSVWTLRKWILPMQLPARK